MDEINLWITNSIKYKRHNQKRRYLSYVIPGKIESYAGRFVFVPDYAGIRDLMLTLTNLTLLIWLIAKKDKE
jgi:hypothetical protein